MAEDIQDKKPLIRYHARVVGGGRIVIPDATRKLLDLRSGDVVKLKVAKIISIKEKDKTAIFEVSPGVVFKAKLGKNGLVTIPEEARKILDISIGDYVEVELLDYYPVRVGEVSILDFV